MVIAKVVGNIVSTIKHTAFNNKKLLMVQPVDLAQRPTGSLILAVDTVGAGDNDLVLVASEGKAAGEILELPPQSPVRSTILGIIDRLETADDDAQR